MKAPAPTFTACASATPSLSMYDAKWHCLTLTAAGHAVAAIRTDAGYYIDVAAPTPRTIVAINFDGAYVTSEGGRP